MATIYAIPGLGCNKLLFQNLHLKNHSLVILNWPLPQKNFTLKDYAKQFLNQIDTSQPFYLLGVSFGGMLCVELNELIKPEKTILISSIKNRNELPAPLKLFKYFPLHLILSEKLNRKVAYLSWRLLGFSKEFLPQYRLMLDSMPENYFKRCANYIVCWSRKENTKPFIHIHGNADKLLWYKNIKQVNYTISNGSHAMVLNQADELIEILEKIV